MGFNRFFSAILDGQPLIQFGDGLQTRDFTFVADAVAATATAAVRGVPGRVYNIGGGSRVSLREVFDLIARVSGRPVTIDQQGPQKGDMRDTYADTSRAQADLGFAPSVTLEEGLRRCGAGWKRREHECDFDWLTALAVVAAIAGGCAAKKDVVPPGTAEADKFLFDKGTEAAKDRKWLNAREYFRNIVDNYPQSPYRPDAKLALGDTYIGEHSTESLLLAANEFREFLTFYPTNPRADYAQLQLAKSFAEQMLAPERDQSATKDAIKEIEVFLQRFPNSALMPEARKLEREAKDRLSEASYRVGFYYFRVEVVSGRHRSLQGSPQARPGVSAIATPSITTWRNRCIEPAESRSAPVLRTLAQRIREDRVPAAAQKRVAELKSLAISGNAATSDKKA